MVTTDLRVLLAKCEAATAPDAALEADLNSALQEHVPAVENAAEADRVLASTDAALTMVAKAFPGWSIVLQGGTGPGAQWHCMLRESEGDLDDQTVAAGRGSTPAMAIALATLKVISGFKSGFR